LDNLPLVTCIIPAYNGEDFIEDCINSILNQDYPKIEIIVVDDASVDNTVEKVCRFPSIRLIRHQKNQGLASTYNTGIKEAKGKYILILHQDCYLISTDWITKAMMHFNDATIGAVTGKYIIDDEQIRHSFMKRISVNLYVQQVVDFDSVQEVPFSEGKCDLFRKDVLESVGLYDERFSSFSSCEDQDLCFRVRKSGFKIIKDPLLKTKLDYGERHGSFGKLYRKIYKDGVCQMKVILKHGFFSFKGIRDLSNIQRRALYAMSKPLFSALTLLALLTILLCPFSIVVSIFSSVLTARIIFLFIYLKTYKSSTIRWSDYIIFPLIGLTFDYVYSIGLLIGLLRRF